jgi:hypothetical protein
VRATAVAEILGRVETWVPQFRSVSRHDCR